MSATTSSNAAPPLLIERRLRWAGFLIALGLIVQLTTFIWIHPLAFIAFVVVACALTASGILLFLYSLASHQGGKGLDDRVRICCHQENRRSEDW